MLKVTATPTWQWQSTKPKTISTNRNVAVSTSLPDIKRAVLPRSLDISFAFSYRR
ncbi:hypothetical protein H3H36_12965 [Duganella sp. FT3S]|uniref:Uncharacterized protein n=1 Tax=Rugamonas fusca TaxID=2758568 RepID=A0A7W2EI96_9BURK|nr:hypothetical protein [Rugamonas fusca]MBA5606265.1 hypothetical protein [Rugamonas fusca]